MLEFGRAFSGYALYYWIVLSEVFGKHVVNVLSHIGIFPEEVEDVAYHAPVAFTNDNGFALPANLTTVVVGYI